MAALGPIDLVVHQLTQIHIYIYITVFHVAVDLSSTKGTYLRRLQYSRIPPFMPLLGHVHAVTCSYGPSSIGPSLVTGGHGRLLAEGLPLQVLRLKEMQLTDEDLLPLLKLFQTEANSLSSGQRLYLEDGEVVGRCVQNIKLLLR